MRIHEIIEAVDEVNPNGHYDVRPMTHPTVLYRSVSIPELADIAKTGKILGGGNHFNEFDPRKFVFFGDQISKMLIWQGEDINRQIINGLKNHRIHELWNAIETERETIKAKIAVEHDRELAQINRERTRRGKELLDSLPDYYADPKLNRSRMSLDDKERKLQAKYREMVRKAESAMNQAMVNVPFTSVILQTKPIMGGLCYWNAFGESKEHEYGFKSGDVGLGDIDHVLLVKDRTVFDEVNVTEIPKLLKTFKAALVRPPKPGEVS